ncbi:SWIM zinc finger domain-containing protein [Streptococcus tangpeifui]|uniref:SWIM zinc finger family protein n=1 Tax=Streptococcus tangpeifui TaxID=2709400 RepID=UPI0013EBBF55|nr:SWIM zinc finger family protein [Streptococcus sp. ZJ1593]
MTNDTMWFDKFSNKILERGFDYYQAGCVFGLAKTSRGYHAFVSGSEDYEVILEIDDDTLEQMWCDCPYALEGHHCKHMAAVLYAIDDDDTEVKNSDIEETDAAIELIAQLTEEELRDALSYLCQTDQSLEMLLVTRYSNKISQKQIAHLKAEFTSLSNKYSDRYGYIDWPKGKSYKRDVVNFLNQKILNLIQKQFNREAFELLGFIFAEIDEQQIENGEIIGALFSHCSQLWEQIYHQADSDFRQEMFIWFNQYQLSHLNDSFAQECVQDFLEEHFQTPEYLEEKLVALDQVIAHLEERQADNDSRYPSYQFEDFVVKRLKLMEDLGYSQEAIESYQKDYWFIPQVRMAAAHKALSEQRLDRAVAILKESKILDNHYKGLVLRHSELLMAIYQKQGAGKDYKDELVKYVLEYDEDNLDKIGELKEVSSHDEWLDYRSRLLSQMSIRGRLALLDKEGLYRQLLDAILSIPFQRHYYLDQYEQTLKNLFPIPVRDAYVKEVSKMIMSASDRKTYRLLADYLKKIATYPDGQVIGSKIVHNWKETYPRKRALLEELRQAGF